MVKPLGKEASMKRDLALAVGDVTEAGLEFGPGPLIQGILRAKGGDQLGQLCRRGRRRVDLGLDGVQEDLTLVDAAHGVVLRGAEAIGVEHEVVGNDHTWHAWDGLIQCPGVSEIMLAFGERTGEEVVQGRVVEVRQSDSATGIVVLQLCELLSDRTALSVLQVENLICHALQARQDLVELEARRARRHGVRGLLQQISSLRPAWVVASIQVLSVRQHLLDGNAFRLALVLLAEDVRRKVRVHDVEGIMSRHGRAFLLQGLVGKREPLLSLVVDLVLQQASRNGELMQVEAMGDTCLQERVQVLGQVVAEGGKRGAAIPVAVLHSETFHLPSVQLHEKPMKRVSSSTWPNRPAAVLWKGQERVTKMFLELWGALA
mmetsp:Transcript_116435/g.163721  ORF Transcript_116435/g.163721 Transcript_116435/m.163721 type:complete len:375 (-) Transcript_116435:186-1310(-)